METPLDLYNTSRAELAELILVQRDWRSRSTNRWRPRLQPGDMPRRSTRPRSHPARYRVGVALRAPDGSVYVGANVENAAYPLGNCAEASAIGALVNE